MAIRIIRTDDDPILRKKSREVKDIDERIIELVDDMFETMYDADGVGLAAPQIGILKRIIVIDIGEGPVCLINPEFVETDGSYIDVEGCLSVPNKNGDVERPYYAKVKGFNLEGQEIIVEGEELMARALCHEIDHLEGVLFTDKIIEQE